MRGFSVSLGELESMCRRMAAEADELAAAASEVRQSDVRTSDFGNGGRQVGDVYVAVIHSALADSLNGIHAATTRLAGTLTDTFRDYERTDQDNRAQF
jgi:NTP pyrophosphatase (non-canonical NTP hydrolase)